MVSSRARARHLRRRRSSSTRNVEGVITRTCAAPPSTKAATDLERPWCPPSHERGTFVDEGRPAPATSKVEGVITPTYAAPPSTKAATDLERPWCPPAHVHGTFVDEGRRAPGTSKVSSRPLTRHLRQRRRRPTLNVHGV